MAMNETGLTTPMARFVWAQRYRHGGSAEPDIAATWRRVAKALAQAEPAGRAHWEQAFFAALQHFRFLPGGRILAGAGTPHRVTLLNCFVMGQIDESVQGICQALQEGALTMRQGGGVGYDFSTLRPHGMPDAEGHVSPGPVAYMGMWDAMSAALCSAGARGGAMMAALRCDHPDIEAFIAAKATPGRLTHFNLSVLISDAFMQAVGAGAAWPLHFPAIPPYQIEREVNARALWQKLLRASFASGEPGVLFIDQINRMNNLSYCETISAANPCGEIPLQPYGGCDLGSFNLAAFIREPFTAAARLDEDALRAMVPVAVRMLDNALDVTEFPLARQAQECRSKRRLGLGITGLADALVMLGLGYGTAAAQQFAGRVMEEICHAAYRASAALAGEKGCFPAFQAGPYLAAPFISALPVDIRDAIARHGIRNSHLLAIAPTGSISLLAGDLSSGVEPVFAASMERTVLDALGTPRRIEVTDYAYRCWRQAHGADTLPPAWVTAAELPAEAHLAMLAALQPHVDNAISKTINLPEDATFEEFSGIFTRAHALGLKGCTVYRAGLTSAFVAGKTA